MANKCHAALIQTHLGDQLIGHVARDSTAIEAREKPKPSAQKLPTETVDNPKRGRPRKGQVRTPKPPTRLEQQPNESLSQMIAALPTACDVGTKRDSKGYKKSWRGYKLHIDTADGDIPPSISATTTAL